MDTIKNYLETLFMNVPKTAETEKAKADLLATMEDHYYELLDEGKSENEAIGSVISEFGSIDELLEALEVEGDQAASEAPRPSYQGEPIQLAEAERYWTKIRSFALKIASGVLLCTIGAGLLIFFANRGAEGLGLSLLFLLVAIAVGFFITGGMSFSREAKLLDDRPISEEVRQEAAFYTEGYSKSFTVSLVTGIALCIMSLIPIFIFQSSYGPAAEGFGVALFLTIAGLGSFLVIYGSIIYTYYKKFSEGVIFVHDEDEMGPNARQEYYGNSHPLFAFIAMIYWPLVTVFYFWWSFNSMGWSYSWLIFVVAGPLFEGLRKLFQITDHH